MAGETKRVYNKPVTVDDPILGKLVPTNDWKVAEKATEQWIKWGQTTEPPQLKTKAETKPTMKQAWTAFLGRRSAMSQATRDKYNILYRCRLAPWCRSQAGLLVEAGPGALFIPGEKRVEGTH